MEFKWGVILAALMLLPMAFAAPGNASEGKTMLLGAASAEAQCRADLMVGYLNAIILAVPNSSSTLSGDASALQADMATLKGYAASGDADAYRKYMQSTFNPALKAAREDIGKRPWKGAGNSTISSLKSSYSQLRTTFDSCQLGALKSFAQERIAIYQNDLDNYTNRTNMIAGRNGSRGMDLSGLNQIENDARGQILDPLRSAISSASNASELRGALDKYCLYDGCKNGGNFHLAVRYGIARLDATLSAAQSRAGGNNSEIFSKAERDLSYAKAALAAIGTSKYDDGSRSSLEKTLKAVSGDMRDALAQARNSMRPRGGAGMNQTGRGFGRTNRTGGNPGPGRGRQGGGMNRTGSNPGQGGAN
jgi:hypothetical protein